MFYCPLFYLEMTTHSIVINILDDHFQVSTRFTKDYFHPYAYLIFINISLQLRNFTKQEENKKTAFEILLCLIWAPYTIYPSSQSITWIIIFINER